MIKKTNDPWCSPKGVSRLKDFIKDLATLSTDADPRLEDAIHCISYDRRNYTVCVTDGKKGVIVSLPPGPNTDSFMATMAKTQVLMFSKDTSPDYATNAMDMLRVMGHMTVSLASGHYRSDKSYPCMALMLRPHNGSRPVKAERFVNFPADREIPVKKFIEKHGELVGPWMVFDNQVSPSTKPHLCPFTLWLDPNTRAQAVGFVIPDPAYETGLESVPGSAGDIQSVIDKFI